MKTIAMQNEGNLLNAVFKAVIIYDDAGYAARATALLERVAVRANEAMKCDVKLWRLDALWQPTLAAITNAVATDANLIMFALNESHLLPEELLNWLERWSANRRVKDVAVALFGAEADAATPLWDELEQFARRHGLAFFGAHGVWDDETFVPGILSQSGTSELRSFAEPDPVTSHWGINE